MIHHQSHSSTALAQLGPGGLGDWAGGAEINKEVIRVGLKWDIYIYWEWKQG